MRECGGTCKLVIVVLSTNDQEGERRGPDWIRKWASENSTGELTGALKHMLAWGNYSGYNSLGIALLQTMSLLTPCSVLLLARSLVDIIAVVAAEVQNLK